MTPPEATAEGNISRTAAPRPAVSLVQMTQRAQFLAAAKARRQGTKGLYLQARKRPETSLTASSASSTDPVKTRKQRREESLPRKPVFMRDAWSKWRSFIPARGFSTSK